MNNKAIQIAANFIADGSTAAFTLDLAHDPYYVIPVGASSGLPEYQLQNFSRDKLLNSPPVGIANLALPGSVESSSLTGTVITGTLLVETGVEFPAAGQAVQMTVTLLF